jgi:hypothetical protein
MFQWRHITFKGCLAVCSKIFRKRVGYILRFLGKGVRENLYSVTKWWGVDELETLWLKSYSFRCTVSCLNKRSNKQNSSLVQKRLYISSSWSVMFSPSLAVLAFIAKVHCLSVWNVKFGGWWTVRNNCTGSYEAMNYVEAYVSWRSHGHGYNVENNHLRWVAMQIRRNPSTFPRNILLPPILRPKSNPGSYKPAPKCSWICTRLHKVYSRQIWLRLGFAFFYRY